MLSFPKLFKATVQLLQSFDQLPAYFFFLNTMLIFMYIMCSIDFQDKSLNRLSPLDSIISPWPTTGRLSHSRKSLLSLYPSFIFLSLPLSFYQATFSSFYLFITHLFFNQAISPISLYHQETSSACEIFQKKIKINPLF